MQATGTYDHIRRRVRQLREKKGKIGDKVGRLSWEDNTPRFDRYLVNSSQLKNILQHQQRVADNSRRVAEQIQTEKLLTPREMGSETLNEMFRQTHFSLDQFYELRQTREA